MRLTDTKDLRRFYDRRPAERQVLATLRLGRARIRRYGWVQGRPGNRACGFCAASAVQARPTNYLADLTRALLDDETSTPDERGVDRWNDAPGRTREQVLALFDRMIARVRVEGL